MRWVCRRVVRECSELSRRRSPLQCDACESSGYHYLTIIGVAADMFQELQFREHYSRLADDELARIALENELVPEAQTALSEELLKRGLTDLSKYKAALAQAAEERSLGRQMEIQARMQSQFAEWGFTLIGWLFAALGPFIWVAAPNAADVLKTVVALTAFIGFSCYLGIRARRRGSRAGYILKFVFPLILLAISTIMVVVANIALP